MFSFQHFDCCKCFKFKKKMNNLSLTPVGSLPQFLKCEQSPVSPLMSAPHLFWDFKAPLRFKGCKFQCSSQLFVLKHPWKSTKLVNNSSAVCFLICCGCVFTLQLLRFGETEMPCKTAQEYK